MFKASPSQTLLISNFDAIQNVLKYFGRTYVFLKFMIHRNAKCKNVIFF